jgi:hypothetical protein
VLIGYPFTIRDSRSTRDDRRSGLRPIVLQCRMLGPTPLSILGGAAPKVVEIGLGQYQLLYDPAYGDAIAQVDAGDSTLLAGDRFIDVALVAPAGK